MTRTEHLLCILGEECTEVGQRASKAMRFGLTEIQEGHSLSNAMRMVHEYADLVAAMEMIAEDVPAVAFLLEPAFIRTLVDAKKKKVDKFLIYSKECGTLE